MSAEIRAKHSTGVITRCFAWPPRPGLFTPHARFPSGRNRNRATANAGRRPQSEKSLASDVVALPNLDDGVKVESLIHDGVAVATGRARLAVRIRVAVVPVTREFNKRAAPHGGEHERLFEGVSSITKKRRNLNPRPA